MVEVWGEVGVGIVGGGGSSRRISLRSRAGSLAVAVG